MFYSFLIWCLQCLGFDPRGIFSFHDGRRWQRVDPSVAARRLWSAMVEQQAKPNMVAPAVPFDSDASRKLIATGIADEMQRGYSEMAQAARFVFQVKPLETGGLTELECAALIDRFEKYIGDVKKNARNWPIGLGNTTASPVESSTKSDSDSGSTSIDNSSDKPESLDLEPPSKMPQP